MGAAPLLSRGPSWWLAIARLPTHVIVLQHMSLRLVRWTKKVVFGALSLHQRTQASALCATLAIVMVAPQQRAFTLLCMAQHSATDVIQSPNMSSLRRMSPRPRCGTFDHSGERFQHLQHLLVSKSSWPSAYPKRSPRNREHRSP